MGVAPEQDRMFRARQLAAASVAGGDDTGWFEKLYAEGEAGTSVVPWVLGEPNESLVEWAAGRDGAGPLDGKGQRALVVGCGTGDDAEFLAGLGFTVTGFDIAPTAIAAARRLHPGSAVRYQVADLLDLPAEWSGAFDLVVEIYTVQPLYGEVRARALGALHGPVAPGGTLLVISWATDVDSPGRDPAMMPWPLTRAELGVAAGPLRVRRIEHFMGRVPPLPRWRAEFVRDPGV
jgi:SAM-dependent methyltransferase